MLAIKSITLNSPSKDAKHGAYKQTELGLIPEDWDWVSVGELIKIFRGGAPLRPSDFTENGIKVLPKGGVVRGGWLRINPSDQQFCSRSYFDTYRNNSVDENFTIVVLRDLVPSGPSIGLIVQIKEPEIFILAQGVYGFKTNGRAVPNFLAQLSNTNWYRRVVNSIMVGSTQVHITNTAFKQIRVPLPSVTEQQAIAEALSDADALIESLEQLIVKKRYINSRLLEDLVTGTKRLPKCSDKWVEKRLGCCAVLKARIGWQGLKTAEYLESGDYCLITGTEFNNGRIDWSKCHYVEKRRYDQDRNIQVKFNDVLVTKDGTIGKVSIIKDMPADATLNSGIFVARPINGSFEPDFFYYVLRSSVFEKFLDQLAAGSTINHLYQKDFVNFVFKVPPTTAEQNEITDILREVEGEIGQLESKLDKAKQIKQGMMQDLLTGKVRLI